MANAYYLSLDEAEVIAVELLPLQGAPRLVRLLVDTGFTGKSSLILDKDAGELVHAQLPPAQTTGALQGQQDRGWVTCRISELGLEQTVIAIITDISVLSLPTGVQGMAGLTFLRHFARWGAEQTDAGWRFCLSDGKAT